MSTGARIAITGTGAAVGDIIRGNDDPAFAYVIANPPPNRDIFDGLTYRRVLGPGQTVVTISAGAALQAMERAGIDASQVDLLVGSATMGEYFAPSALTQVHAYLQLPASCRVLALNSEYSPYVDGLRVANDMVAAGSVKCALVVAACAWTHHMDYHQAVCVAASDGAGAAVVTRTDDASAFALVDWENVTDSSWFGAFRMAPRPLTVPPHYAPSDALYTKALMALDDVRGAEAVKGFGLPMPVTVVKRLLERRGLDPSQIALVSHQTSKLVEGYWKSNINPGTYISTLRDYADMVSATAAVNLATCADQITQDHMVILGIGMEMHATALLYSRQRS
jgi:3-oxoacyl-[acyl-carrier-protein] synthase-3